MADKNGSIVAGYDWKGKKVLITGASGFKGSWLCQVLLELGSDVYGITRQVQNPLSAYNLFGLNERIGKLYADITNEQQVVDVLNSVSPDVIFHLAAKAQVPTALRDPRRTFDINIMGTINIIEGCRKLRVGERLLVVSTDHVFGMVDELKLPKGGFGELDSVAYHGPYDTSKSAMELCVKSYYSIYSKELPNIGITRAANVFGYGDVAFRRVIPVFVKSSLNQGKVQLTCRKNGRQFIHITDVVEGYIRAASVLCGTEKGEIYPLTPTFHFAIEDYGKSDENYIRIEELAKLFKDIFKIEIVTDDSCKDYAPNENQIQALNCTETYKKLNWKPRTSLKEGIEQLKDWYKPRSINDHKYLSHLIIDDSQRVVEALKKEM